MDAALRTSLDRFTFLQNYFCVAAKPRGYCIAEGLIAGSEPFTLWGYNTAVPVTEEAVWYPSSVYTWQTVDQTPKVVSSDADDDDGDTGANTVRVWWLNSANVEAYEDVTMNGTTNVDMVATTVRRINRVEVLTVGSTGYNEGSITVYATDGATVMAYIPSGMCISDGLIQTVPAGYRDIISELQMDNCTGHMLYFRLYVRTSPTAPWIMRDVSAVQHAISHSYVVPLVFAAGTDYYVSVLDSTGGNPGSAILTGWREAV